jgi:hypothetical protein
MREATMSIRRRSRPIGLGLLGVALALQAITPDARDLASPMLHKLLSSMAGREAATTILASDSTSDPESESPPLGGGSSPSRTDDQSKQADEVCLPGSRQVGMMMHRRGAGTDRPSFCSRPSVQVPIYPVRRSLSPPRFVALKSSDKIVLLGRLTC